MYESYKGNYVFHFIRLQVADEVPFYILGQSLLFGNNLLHMAFAKQTLARFCMPPLWPPQDDILTPPPDGYLRGVALTSAILLATLIINFFLPDVNLSQPLFGCLSGRICGVHRICILCGGRL